MGRCGVGAVSQLRLAELVAFARLGASPRSISPLWLITLASPEPSHSLPVALSSNASLRSKAGCDHGESLSRRRDYFVIAIAYSRYRPSGFDIVGTGSVRGCHVHRCSTPSRQYRAAGVVGSRLALIVTPFMHKVHHSRWEPETDSNYSSLFSFGTVSLAPPVAAHSRIRLNSAWGDFNRLEDHTLIGLLTTPLKQIRRTSGQTSGRDEDPRKS